MALSVYVFLCIFLELREFYYWPHKCWEGWMEVGEGKEWLFFFLLRNIFDLFLFKLSPPFPPSSLSEHWLPACFNTHYVRWSSEDPSFFFFLFLLGLFKCLLMRETQQFNRVLFFFFSLHCKFSWNVPEIVFHCRVKYCQPLCSTLRALSQSDEFELWSRVLVTFKGATKPLAASFYPPQLLSSGWWQPLRVTLSPGAQEYFHIYAHEVKASLLARLRPPSPTLSCVIALFFFQSLLLRLVKVFCSCGKNQCGHLNIFFSSLSCVGEKTTTQGFGFLFLFRTWNVLVLFAWW